MIARLIRVAAIVAVIAYIAGPSARFITKSPRPIEATSFGDVEPQDQPDEAIEFQNLKRAPGGEGPIPVEKYMKAVEHIRRMPQHSTVLNRFISPLSATEANDFEQEALGAWTQLGPGNIGGRTRALMIHPTSPNIMYAGGVAGGVWKTTNSGQSWTA